MKHGKIVKLAVCYLACLALTAFLCIWFLGSETLLRYASKSKPYSILLSAHSLQTPADSANARTIICFGDSTSFLPPDLSLDTGNFSIHIPGLIYESVNPEGTQQDLQISEWAFCGATMFEYYCLFYNVCNLSPDLIVVPINWRSFGTLWTNNPGWFCPELSAFVPLREKLFSDYKNPVTVRGISTVKQIEYKIYLRSSLYLTGLKAWALEKLGPFFKNTLDSNFGSNPWMTTESAALAPKEGEKSPEALKETLRKDYPMEIEASNPTFVSLCALADAASDRGIKVLFFIWPLDQQYLADVGVLDKAALERSIKVIAKATDKKGIYLLDLSGLLEHKYFFDADAHCRVQGRRKIAEALAPKVMQILQNEGARRLSAGSDRTRPNL